MVRSYKKKEGGGRKSYATSQAMVDAYNAVMAKQMSAYQASKHFKVDKKSLLRRVRDEIPINAHAGRSTVLCMSTEELAKCLLVLADWGWGFGKEELKDIVQDYMIANALKNPFVEDRPGRDWLENFLKRHPKIAPRKTEHLSNSRAEAEDPDVIEKWFQLLESILGSAGVKGLPDQIFNCDESGFVTDPKSQVVLARTGANRVNKCIGGSGREQVTVNCTVSASGQILPPYVVYKGKNLYMDWTQGGPEGTAFTTSEKGWMEGPQFLDWFKTVFLRNTKNLSSHPRILIFDDHVSHVTLPLVEEAKKNNVILLRLPSHLTHLLQPLDTSVFRTVKSKWQSLLIKYARTHSGPVSKKHFPGMLKNLYKISFTADQVKSGFRGTGIFPFNKDAIDTSSFTQRPQQLRGAFLNASAQTSTSTSLQLAQSSSIPVSTLLPSLQSPQAPASAPTEASSSSTPLLPSLQSPQSLAPVSTEASSSSTPMPLSIQESPSSHSPSTISSSNSSIKVFFFESVAAALYTVFWSGEIC